MPPEGEPPKKKTRRRLRVSCVECTRRRQKCDRTQPCGLCKRRGVENLCRWELEPFARPPPSRPQASRKLGNKSSTIGRAGNPPRVNNGQKTVASSQASIIHEATVEHEVKEAAIALAQLSVARHGEYLGTGSLVCALHRLNDSSEAKIPVDKSSGQPFSRSSQYSSSISNTFLVTLQSLVSDFPDRSRSDVLLTSFFEQDNWRFGLAQKPILFVYNSMWETIASDERSVERINFNWVAFLFAMFALSSGCSSEGESRKYFLQALTAKRLAEDVQYASFFTPKDSGTFSQGTAHGCMASALIAEYMCDRGQLTEAWKLIGSAVRSAQNAGLHLDPAWSKWKDMTNDEQTMRRLAWHMCASKDRLLSLALGRPGIVRSCDYHVFLQEACPPLLAADGSSDANCFYQANLVRLIESVAEEKDKHLCIHPDTSAGGDHFDSKMSSWEASLPAYLALQKPDTSFDGVYPRLRLQRCLLTCHHHFCRMLFHRSLPCIGRLDGSSDELLYKNQWNFDRLTQFAIDLLHTQKSFLEMLESQRQVYFTTTYFIFEAAVTLSIAICRDPMNTKMGVWRKERDAAIDLLQSLLSMDNSELTQQAVVVLRILQDRRPCGQASSVAPSTGEVIEDLPSLSPNGLAQLLLDPQSATALPMFSIDALQSQDLSLGTEQCQLDFNSALSLSGFDFLFNTAIP